MVGVCTGLGCADNRSRSSGAVSVSLGMISAMLCPSREPAGEIVMQADTERMVVVNVA
jgi:hypothetical protein